ncbi:MAG: ABC transporter ATP-binding protein [Eubacterium sp.]|nr:ABC transporter ATP-binding protein [Eubacterium sp.]
MESVKIELQNISKSYYSVTAVTQALRKVNLTFHMGEFVAITGESGSGKSTLLNIIGGMDTFDEGEMFVDGEPTFQYDNEDWETFRRNKIGYIFQDYSLVGHYTALDNVVSALVIMGVDHKDAQTTALTYLDQVGLAGYEHHKASELSSGQKQRLSIARALAKNTDIIVADEPTGNLDSETGIQIIELLKELSKERLVIMVTHNFDQAEPYVTRKIRIHDGQVISDVKMNEEAEKEPVKESVPAPERKPIDFKRENKIAAMFAKLNFFTQKTRATLFIVFLLVISSVSFLFIGELFAHGDDFSTRSYSKATFYKEDDTRIVVKRTDGKDITREDVKTISTLSDVVTVDSCDIANDINYYMKEGEDYKYIYGQSRGRKEVGVQKVEFLKEDQFMQSTDCISEDDLVQGRMPKARNEIVLYSKSTTKLNKKISCFFVAHNIWQSGQYYKMDLKVVGLLKEPTDQVYFSKDLCRMLSMRIDSGIYRILYTYDQELEDYRNKPDLIPVIADDLFGNQIRTSDKLETSPTGDIEFTYAERDENGAESSDKLYGMVSHVGTHDNTSDFMEVSQQFFDRYYTKNSKQASVYIVSYAKTDKVINQLNDMGYEAISTYRVSMTDFQEELVNQRLIIIGISGIGLIAILFAEILILRSLMKIRVKDYFVLKFIGMKMQVIRKISYFEMSLYTAISILLTVAIMWILKLAGIRIIEDIMWFYTPLTYFLFVIYNFVLIILTVASFNKILKGRLNQ